jgi:hypothetical protein
MKKILVYCCFLLFVCAPIAHAQVQTVGLLYTSSEVTEGYTLYTPETNKTTYLINNCGELVKSWQFNEMPGATCYLLPNGNLLRAGKDTLEIRDWDNNSIWSFAITAELGLNQHHDIEPLPNGNIVCIVSDSYSSAEMEAIGKDVIAVPGIIDLDKVIELQPLGIDSAAVVWEWKFVDHFIQDFDPTKLNYGVVENHPELIDINYNTPFFSDYTHVNAIDYNANLDQIMISARSLNEIMIIDHSTTTAEASSHAGGVSGKGGDLLWRWGNPSVYRQGTSNDAKLFIQHDCKWVEDGYTDAGKITVFNNGGDDGTETYSSIHIISPTIVNNVYQSANNLFLPQTYEWSWSGSILGDVVFENKKSGTHALPNGNFIICETAKGRVSEINRAGDLLWSYVNPTSQNAIYNQFDVVTSSNNRMFRAEKYPVDYIGFTGKVITSMGILENQNTLSDSCISILLGSDELDYPSISLTNPVVNNNLQFHQPLVNETVKIVDMQGNVVYHKRNVSGSNLQLELSKGVYFLQLNTTNERFKIIVE